MQCQDGCPSLASGLHLLFLFIYPADGAYYTGVVYYSYHFALPWGQQVSPTHLLRP
jgi:hypothetical protein